MPELASRIVPAAIEFAVRDNRRTDARADDHIDYAALAAARAKVILAQASRLGVMLQAHRHAQPLAQQRSQRRMVQTENIGRVEQDAVEVIDRPRRADAHRRHLAARRRLCLQRLNGCRNPRHHRRWPQSILGRKALARHNAIVRRHQPDLDLGAAEVDASHP